MVGADVRTDFSTGTSEAAARQVRYQGYLDEVADWKDLRSSPITLASPAPLPEGVVAKNQRRPAKRKAAAQPATMEPAEDDDDDAARDAGWDGE